MRREKLAGWALRGLFRQLGKRVPPDLQRRLEPGRPVDKKAILALLRDAFARAYPGGAPTGAPAVLDEAVRFMLQQFDPEAIWRQTVPFNDEPRWRPSDPGLRLTLDVPSGMVRVITPIKGGPAYQAGLRAGDLITHITPASEEGGPAKAPMPTRGLSVEQAEKLLLGDFEARVRLTVRRDGVRRPLVFDVKLGFTRPETVLGWRRRADDEWDYWLDPKSKIGYVRITALGRNTANGLRDVMGALTRDGLKALVLDLRYNPGRLLDGAIKVSDLFIDDGLIVSLRPRVGRESKLRGRRAGSLLGFPMVCLINDETASGSEIVAACLQDHKRARIVGVRSKGHASWLNWHWFDDLDRELGLTTVTGYRPSGGKLDWRPLPGRPADEWGVRPSAGLTVVLSELEKERLRQRLEETAYLFVRGRERPAVVIDRQRDAALAQLRRQLALPARR
jgi:carboxyl-terminal processing protease